MDLSNPEAIRMRLAKLVLLRDYLKTNRDRLGITQEHCDDLVAEIDEEIAETLDVD